jgi:hypothetical protein
MTYCPERNSFGMPLKLCDLPVRQMSQSTLQCICDQSAKSRRQGVKALENLLREPVHFLLLSLQVVENSGNTLIASRRNFLQSSSDDESFVVRKCLSGVIFSNGTSDVLRIVNVVAGLRASNTSYISHDPQVLGEEVL